MSSEPVGGGAKKVLYTLETVRRIGVSKATKALTSKNTCKACAFGMGGQLGGMTNEAGEFPSVCNKSVQAQSTDIQPAIPDEIFNHPLSELRGLKPMDIEKLGCLGNPIYKPAGSDKYSKIDWEKAIELAAERFSNTSPERTFFIHPDDPPMRQHSSFSYWRGYMARIMSTTVHSIVTKQPAWDLVQR